LIFWFWVGWQSSYGNFSKRISRYFNDIRDGPWKCSLWRKNRWRDSRVNQKRSSKLFDRWADVVILACNTASVHALRWLQQEVFVGRHILGVMIPWAEKILELWHRKVWVLATEATVRIRGYRERVHITDNTIHIEEIAAPGLVPLIEQGIIDGEDIDELLYEYLGNFSPDIESLILGCTHYPLTYTWIEKAWTKIHKNKTPIIIDPGVESAKKFREWRKRKGLLL
jgi:glutamate racemase